MTAVIQVAEVQELPKAPEVNEVPDGLIVNRGGIKHKDAVLYGAIISKIHGAVKNDDADSLLTLMGQRDVLLQKMVVAVPDGWLPDGVTLADEHWIDEIAQDRYDMITDLVNVSPGKKAG